MPRDEPLRVDDDARLVPDERLLAEARLDVRDGADLAAGGAERDVDREADGGLERLGTDRLVEIERPVLERDALGGVERVVAARPADERMSDDRDVRGGLERLTDERSVDARPDDVRGTAVPLDRFTLPLERPTVPLVRPADDRCDGWRVMVVASRRVSCVERVVGAGRVVVC